MVSKRFARANKPRIESYDPSKPTSHILYLDANNLCWLAVSQPLPTSGFEWVEDCNRLTETISDHPDGPEGYILEMDLEYPEELHSSFMHILLHRSAWWSRKSGSQSISTTLGVGVAHTEVQKLVPNLHK